MSRRLFQLVAGLVLIMATLTPAMELFGHWDTSTTVPANDTELNVTAWFVGVGIVLTLAKLLRYVPLLTNASKRSDHQVLCLHQTLRLVENDRLEPTGSPPLISLRI